MAESALRIAQTWLQNLKDSASTGNINAELNKAAILFCHHLTDSLVPCSAAAYTASIEHYERKFLIIFISKLKICVLAVLNQCKRLVAETIELYDSLKKEDWNELNNVKLDGLLSSMNELQFKMGNLPTNVDIDSEAVGNQLHEVS